MKRSFNTLAALPGASLMWTRHSGGDGFVCLPD